VSLSGIREWFPAPGQRLARSDGLGQRSQFDILNEVSIPGVSIEKPKYVFGRDREWGALCEYVQTAGPGPRLGLVYGRRRQGKTLLLEALCEATGGFLWQARQQSAPQNLRSLEEAIGRFSGTTPRLSSWDDAIDSLLGLRIEGKAAPLPVVIDEVGYLLDVDPGFASRL
jgi:uncharacterized protein